jgi:hypothetical protein
MENKYFNNPHGLGRIFLIEDSKGDIKGTLGYIPIVISDKENVQTHVMQAADLFIAPDARGKQLFPKLQKFAMNRIDYPLIAFPNRRSEIITIKLGWKKTGKIDKWLFPIQLDSVTRNAAIRILVHITNLVLNLYTLLFLRGSSNKVKLTPVKKFKNHFRTTKSKLWNSHSTEFLNWRFDDNFMGKYIKFEFHHKQNVIGYCVVKKEKTAGAIYDFYVSSYQRACLRAIIENFRKEGMNRIIFRGVGLKLWRFGFTKWFCQNNFISYNLDSKPKLLTLALSDW